MESTLAAVKDRVWFYEFDLPDDSLTRTNMPPEVLRIHTSRRDKLRRVIQTHVGDASALTALDFASHEGYFSVELARHFRSVTGIEFKADSLEAARAISSVLGVGNVAFRPGDLTRMEAVPDLEADFVLIYGLMYHLENPIQVLRLASQLSRRHVLIETQVFPYEISGMIEDGHYRYQREVQGVFSLSPDYADGREGGSTNLALVPSLNALKFLLKEFGFRRIETIGPDPDDYEQFQRRSRVILYGEK